MYARPRPLFGDLRTRAPRETAISEVRSVELSMISTSPRIPAAASPSMHQSTKSATVCYSFSAGMTMDSSGSGVSSCGTRSRSSTSAGPVSPGAWVTADRPTDWFGIITSTPKSTRLMAGDGPGSGEAGRSASRAALNVPPDEHPLHTLRWAADRPREERHRAILVRHRPDDDRLDAEGRQVRPDGAARGVAADTGRGALAGIHQRLRRRGRRRREQDPAVGGRQDRVRLGHAEADA